MRGHLRDARCSFCGKRQDQVRKLVAGPGVYICDHCVALCNEVLAEAPPTPPVESTGRRGGWIRRIFGLRRPHAMARLFLTSD